MTDKMKEALQAALDELLAMPREELLRELDEVKNDPLYGIFQELENFSEFFYREWEKDLWMHMVWRTKEQPF